MSTTTSRQFERNGVIFIEFTTLLPDGTVILHAIPKSTLEYMRQRARETVLRASAANNNSAHAGLLRTAVRRMSKRRRTKGC